MNRKPLVTICVPNYNYGQYLEHCLESILNQTYPNIEVHFSDNASTDNSYEIAQEFRKKFLNKGIYFKINDNKRNVGSDANSKLAARESEGEFIYTLASDDAIYPTFIEKCIDIFEMYPSVGTVIVNRDEIDENDKITKIPPFYNTSCVIKGEDQAAVYMMAGIAIPGQRMVRRTVLNQISSFFRGWNVAGDWYDNFLYSCVADVAYIKEDLIQYRVHSGNETSESEKNLLGIAEHYQLINAFVDISKAFGLKKPVARFEEAVEHLGEMCLRYTLRMLKDNQIKAAKKYLQLSSILKEDIVNQERYKQLNNIVRDNDMNRIKNEVEAFLNMNNLNRTNSYAPPEGSIILGE